MEHFVGRNVLLQFLVWHVAIVSAGGVNQNMPPIETERISVMIK